MFDFYSKAVSLELGALGDTWVFPKDVKGLMIRNTSPTITRTILLDAYAPGSTQQTPIIQVINLYIPPNSTLVFPIRFYRLNGPLASTTVEVYELY